MNLEQGDYLELKFKDTIRQLIPNYETIWGSYIGHDGNGRMINVIGLTAEENTRREKFAEHFYTCMESMICMNYIAEEYTITDLTNPSEYLNLLNSFMAFQAHAGRVRDNSNELLGLHFTNDRVNELMPQLEDLYQQRNQVLHGKKLPVRIEESLVLIAPPMGKEDRPEKWNSKMNWTEFPESNFEFISEYLKSTVTEISNAYNNMVGNLITPILDIVKTNGIKLDEIITKSPTSNGLSGFQGPISASNSINGL